MMSFHPSENLPQPELEPGLDWALMDFNHHNRQSLVLAYACQRDFLSVPKTYALLEFSGTQETPLIYQTLPKDDFFTCLTEQQNLCNGIFEARDDSEERVLLVSPLTVTEILFATMTVLPNIYHCSDSGKAIVEYLS